MKNKNVKVILISGIAITIVAVAACMFFSFIAAGICAVLGIMLTLVFYMSTKKRYDEIAQLNNYISQICAGNYSLDIGENTEGELSILKNNLYKVITILKTQNEMLANDKVYLADALADITHQLKTPLTSMMVMTDLLMEERNDEKKKEFVQVIESQLEKMKWLITNLLKISKLDAGTTEFKSERVSIDEVINESLNQFLVMLDLREIEINNSIEAFDFHGDKSWSIEAVENIIKNCIEHSSKGGKLIFKTNLTSIYNELTISDTGCGISKEDIPHIFERFYHGKNSSSESVGIGLALAKTILEKEKAKISVESVENEGTTFSIKFYKSIV